MGPDEIGPRILKELASTIAPILTEIYRKSYNTGKFPEDWKRANVVAVFKKGRKSEASNYRPISLTCVCCKILEHIIANIIMRHTQDHNILYDLQHGFRGQHSCETQLLEFQADMQNIVQGKKADAIIFDFSKAFDKVSHKMLAAKMKYYGIREQTNAWIRGFLADRSQTVVLQGSQSYETEVKSGVPQGSVLGPCLFLFYINDLPDTLASDVRLFADDTVAYLAIGQQQDTTTLQDDLSKLEQWKQKRDMEFHPKKCQVLTFSRKHNTVKFDYKLHGHTLERVKEAKYLEVTFQQELRFSTHINKMTPKANRTLGFVRHTYR